MKALIAASSLALALMVPSMVSASELKPLEAGTYKLGAQNVSVFYTADGDAYKVITTIAPDYDAPGVPIRFVSLLRPGQTETVSVGSFEGNAGSATLELVHEGDGLSVSEKIQTANLN